MAVKPVSKLFYLGSILGVPILGIIMGAVLMFVIDPMIMKRDEPPVPFVLITAGLILYSTVMYLRLLYKAWAAIQDGQARTTPGKAVGFCFIPFFNFYWIFQAFYGFAVDFNSYAARNSIALRLSEGLFLAYSILLLASLLPLISALAILPLWITLVIMIVRLCDAINAVAGSATTNLAGFAEL